MLHDKATARSLGMVRIWVFGLAVLSRLLTPTWEVCMLPHYQPPGIMQLLGAQYWVPLITPEIAYGIQGLTIGLLLLVAAGVGSYRLLAPLACLALIISEGLVRGTPVPTHANITLILSCCVLSCFPVADALTLFRRKGVTRATPVQYQATLVSLSLVFCLTYLFVAARRFSVGGMAIFFDDSILSAIAVRDAEMGSAGGLGKSLCESVLGAWSMRLGFPVVTVFEFLTPLCIFSTRFRWAWLAVMVPFHIGAGFLMGIWFTYNFALIPILIAGFDPFRSSTNQSLTEQAPDVHPQKMKLAA